MMVPFDESGFQPLKSCLGSEPGPLVQAGIVVCLWREKSKAQTQRGDDGISVP